MRPAQPDLAAVARAAHAADAELTKLCPLPVPRWFQHLRCGRFPGVILVEVFFIVRAIMVVRRCNLCEGANSRQRGREAARFNQIPAKIAP